MATTTTNLGLKKPEQTDFYDIDIINENMDIIDEKMQGKAENSHKHDFEDISGTLPISNGGTGQTSAAGARASLGILTANEIANLYVYKKYPGEPGEKTETEESDVILTSKTTVYGSAYSELYYANDYAFDGETFTLTSPTRIGFNSSVTDSTVLERLAVVKGKYVAKKESGASEIFLIPASATISKKSVAMSAQMIADSATKIISNSMNLKYAASKTKSYPENGKYSSDGYWYVYHKILGE